MQRFFFLLVPLTTVLLVGFFCHKIFGLYGLYRYSTIKKILYPLGILLPILFVTSYTFGNFYYSKINSIINIISGTWLGGLAFFFILAVVLGALYPITKNLPPYILPIIIYTGFIFVLFITGLAVYTASNPIITNFEIHSTKLAPLWKDKKIVLVSDTHLGLLRDKHFAQKVTNLINTQNPDLVLMAGDLIDGPKIPYEDFASPFGNILSTYGVYYTPGNHEWYNVEPEKFIGTMKHLTKALIDEKIEVNGTQIIGINFAREIESDTKNRLTSTGYDSTKPSIAMLHDPKNNDALRIEGVDLVVSGHTHCGQFWPFSLLVKGIYKDKAYGVRQFEDSATITTCGIGTALAPMRLGKSPEIVVIQIK